jgi:3-oxoacyl-[acyl-carrier-protein] synthase II
MSNGKKRVVVTGGSIVSALGNDWPQVLEALKRGKNCVRRMADWDKYTGMNTRLAAPVDFVMPDYPRKKIRGMGRIAQMALVATDEALRGGAGRGANLYRGVVLLRPAGR